MYPYVYMYTQLYICIHIYIYIYITYIGGWRHISRASACLPPLADITQNKDRHANGEGPTSSPRPP